PHGNRCASPGVLAREPNHAASYRGPLHLTSPRRTMQHNKIKGRNANACPANPGCRGARRYGDRRHDGRGARRNHHRDALGPGVLTSAGGGTSVRNTLAGDLPFGEVALPAAIMAINSGQPIKMISGGVETVADILWITQPDSPFNSIKDLAGKKVAFTSPGSVTNMLILMCLKAAGMEPKDVKLLPAGDNGAN